MVDEFLLDHFDLFLSAGRDGMVNSGCAEPTLAICADPGTFADDKAGRGALLIVFAHEIIGQMPGIACAPAGEGSHHDSVG
jgi:hypothetical protein